MREVKVEEKIQKLLEQLNTGAEFSPSYVDEFFTSNIVKRVLAYLMAWDYLNNQAVKLQATPDGILRVSALPAFFTVNECFQGTAPDEYGIPIEFSAIVHHVDIWVYNHDIVLQRSVDGMLWYGEIILSSDSYYGFDAVTKYIRLKNAESGLAGSYQIVGWR
ncbi:MAG: hypothetical protein QXG12_06470 [Thermoproteota archaeon]